MLSISDFARFGQVSVRMLRHYDSIGLLPPAAVDRWTGYRSYSAEQLARLNRIVALKELGFTLEQVRHLLDDEPSAQQLRGMLTLRLAQLQDEQARARARLAQVESRLRLIDQEDHMPDIDYVTKSLPARTIAAARGHAREQPEIAGVVGPLFARVAHAVSAAGGRPGTGVGVGVGVYDMTEEGMDMLIGYDCAPGTPADAYGHGPTTAGAPIEIVDLPPVPDAVCAVHLGAMATIHESWQALSRRAEADGWSPAGPCREVYLRADPSVPQDDWVTELQQPVSRA